MKTIFIMACGLLSFATAFPQPYPQALRHNILRRSFDTSLIPQAIDRFVAIQKPDGELLEPAETNWGGYGGSGWGNGNWGHYGQGGFGGYGGYGGYGSNSGYGGLDVGNGGFGGYGGYGGFGGYGGGGYNNHRHGWF